jgi:hypothetical protein
MMIDCGRRWHSSIANLHPEILLREGVGYRLAAPTEEPPQGAGDSLPAGHERDKYL